MVHVRFLKSLIILSQRFTSILFIRVNSNVNSNIVPSHFFLLLLVLVCVCSIFWARYLLMHPLYPVYVIGYSADHLMLPNKVWNCYFEEHFQVYHFSSLFSSWEMHSIWILFRVVHSICLIPLNSSLWYWNYRCILVLLGCSLTLVCFLHLIMFVGQLSLVCCALFLSYLFLFHLYMLHSISFVYS